jgi:hypothetical protein
VQGSIVPAVGVEHGLHENRLGHERRGRTQCHVDRKLVLGVVVSRDRRIRYRVVYALLLRSRSCRCHRRIVECDVVKPTSVLFRREPGPQHTDGRFVANGGNGGWYIGSGIPTGSTYGGIGAGGGGGGFQGGWADPWESSGQAVPTDANPQATSSANQYLTGSTGSAAECGAGGGSSWLTDVATNIQTGSNASTNGTVTVLYDPPGSSQITSSSQVPVYQSTW